MPELPGAVSSRALGYEKMESKRKCGPRRMVVEENNGIQFMNIEKLTQ